MSSTPHSHLTFTLTPYLSPLTLHPRVNRLSAANRPVDQGLSEARPDVWRSQCDPCWRLCRLQSVDGTDTDEEPVGDGPRGTMLPFAFALEGQGGYSEGWSDRNRASCDAVGLDF